MGQSGARSQAFQNRRSCNWRCLLSAHGSAVSWQGKDDERVRSKHEDGFDFKLARIDHSFGRKWGDVCSGTHEEGQLQSSIYQRLYCQLQGFIFFFALALSFQVMMAKRG